MSATIIGLGAAFGAAFLALFTVQDVVLERHRVYKSLRAVRSIELTAPSVGRQELAKPVGERLLLPALRRTGSLARRFTPASVTQRLSHELAIAGSPAGWDAERIVATKLLGIGAGAATGFVISKLAHLAGLRAIIVFALFAVVGWYLPEWVLRAKSGKRQAEMRRVLPDALDLLSITVEAGLGFDAALDRVARHAGGPLGEELNRVLREMQLGTSRADALRSLGERTTVEELRGFVLAMVQADVFGIAIAKVLHVQASELRMKRRQRAEEKAMKVPVKIIFPVLFCIFPALFLVVIGPAAMNIYHMLLHR